MRATLVLLIIVALSVGYLLATGQAWTDFALVPDGALLAGIALGAYAAGGMALARYKRRLEDLRAERVALDQADLTALLQERARTGLTEVYARMAEWLQRTELVLSRAVADVAERSVSLVDDRRVALSGGVFCNGLLLTMTRRALSARGFTALTHRLVPPAAMMGVIEKGKERSDVGRNETGLGHAAVLVSVHG